MPHTFNTDAAQDETFSRLTRLIRNTLGVDIAAVSTIDDGVQSFKSIDGLRFEQISLENSFCRVAFRDGCTIVMPDTGRTEEFQDHKLVTEAGLKAYVGIPLKTSSGAVFGTICGIHKTPRKFSERDLIVLEDIANIAASELELREHATVDMLTGALTRRAFMHDSARLKELLRRKGLVMTVVMVDIDHFKAVNDKYGHASGDEVLKSVAMILKVNLRKYDLLGRLGGEEFCIALEGDMEKARGVTERLRQAVSSLQFTFADRQTNVTASFGIAEFRRDEGFNDALKRADIALYAAKTAGRDCIVTATD
ncbi:sensor domain-containing diguanylate cyclase [Rhizobium panacihumi]|uniref:sensor domain-containing diguanylate cyclase n=1 Tax=Rhizobium panacihumi TaxID=2008450 RepID=UPI003D7B636E